MNRLKINAYKELKHKQPWVELLPTSFSFLLLSFYNKSIFIWESLGYSFFLGIIIRNMYTLKFWILRSSAISINFNCTYQLSLEIFNSSKNETQEKRQTLDAFSLHFCSATSSRSPYFFLFYWPLGIFIIIISKKDKFFLRICSSVV